jgi:hypothetical protein
MNEITIFPEQLSAMTDAELASLPPAQLREVHHNLAQLVEWVKKAQVKLHGALQRRYAEQVRAARAEVSKDFGVIRFRDGPVEVTVDTPKRVSWDQKQLAEMAKRIAASGDRVEDYLDLEFSVSESRFSNWPTTLREQFASARTVKPGKASYELSPISED